jgi:hypothetical protein
MLFIAPVGTGARVRAHASLESRPSCKMADTCCSSSCTLGIDGDPKLALVAEGLCMLIGKPDDT